MTKDIKLRGRIGLILVLASVLLLYCASISTAEGEYCNQPEIGCGNGQIDCGLNGDGEILYCACCQCGLCGCCDDPSINGCCDNSGCVPTTCSALGKACGSWGDGCGGTLNCGTCASPQVCDTAGQCCTPKTCADIKKECGSGWDNGCGGTLTCGDNGACANSLETCTGGTCCSGLETSCSAGADCCSGNCAGMIINSGFIEWSSLVQNTCCNIANLAGPNSKCYPASNDNSIAVDVGIEGNDKSAAPSKAGWTDCDVSEVVANGMCKNVCYGGWVKWGASGFGEYNNDPGSSGFGCCGDDSGEYITEGVRVIGTTGPRCCPRPDDCVDENGQCVQEGTLSGGKMCGTCGWMFPNMDGTTSGCCPEENMCVVDPNGDEYLTMGDWYTVDWENETNPFFGPMCIYQNEFLLDKRCEEGSSWGSRTRYLSLIMLSSIDANQDFTLYCDEYKNSLNYFKQVFDKYQLDISYLEKNGECGIYPCLGDYFCVLLDKNDNIRAVGGTLNPDREGELNNVELLYTILGINPDDVDCPTWESSNEFMDCGMGLSYDAALNAFIYAKSETGSGSVGIFGMISDFFTSLFRTLFKKYVSIQVSDVMVTTQLYDYRYPDFNRLYYTKIGPRKILAFEESLGNTERLIANYTGFNMDICLQMNRLANSSTLFTCTYGYGNYYVFANRTIGRPNLLFDNWQTITSKLRLSSMPSDCPPYTPPEPCEGTLVDLGLDENGCQLTPECNTCPPVISPICPPDEILVPQPNNAIGCPLPAVCQSCPSYALPYCPYPGVIVSGYDANGCPEPMCQSFCSTPPTCPEGYAAVNCICEIEAETI